MHSNWLRTKITGRFLLVLLIGLGYTGCTYPIVMAAVRGVPTEPGTKRNEILKVLGTPRQSQPFDPAVAGSSFANAPTELRKARVSLYEEYRISGLVMTSPDNPWAGFPEGYTVGMYLTLGLGEMIYFPVTMVELAVSSSQHDELRLWYDQSGSLIATDRRH